MEHCRLTYSREVGYFCNEGVKDGIHFFNEDGVTQVASKFTSNYLIWQINPSSEKYFFSKNSLVVGARKEEFISYLFASDDREFALFHLDFLLGKTK